jgi:hypothetical protein
MPELSSQNIRLSAHTSGTDDRTQFWIDAPNLGAFLFKGAKAIPAQPVPAFILHPKKTIDIPQIEF